MRILVVIYEFPPVGGGGGQVARDICHGLVNSGHEVRVLTAHLNDLPRQEQIDGFHVTRIPSWRRQAYEADLLAMAGFVISGSIAGFREIRRWHPDLIHVQMLACCVCVVYQPFTSLFSAFHLVVSNGALNQGIISNVVVVKDWYTFINCSLDIIVKRRRFYSR